MTLDQRDQKAGAQQIHVEGGSRGDDFVSVGRDRKSPLDVVEHIESGLALCEGELARVCAVAELDFALRIHGDLRAVGVSYHAMLPRPCTVVLRALSLPSEELYYRNREEAGGGGQ